MVALLLISIASFFALFFAMLTLLRHAAINGGVVTSQTRERARPATGQPSPLLAAAALQSAGEAVPALRAKRPDWRFLVRDGRRPFPSGQTISPARKPPARTTANSTRSDWALYNKDLGDLNDPYQAAPPAPPQTARHA